MLANLHPIHVAQAVHGIVTGITLMQGLIALAAIIGVTVLVFAGKLDSSAAVGLYSAVLGYVFGVASNVANTPPEP